MELWEKEYNSLFTNDDKISSFDKIAKQYYFCNFGTMQKSELDILMFSIYLDQILKQSEEKPSTYSDYHLSKILGITQTRISNLKVKKELKYSYEKFDWKQSFLRILPNARFENGKIKINIYDINLYLEIKNAIEEKGDYVDVLLNQKLLQITPACFLDLLTELVENEKKNSVKKAIKDNLEKNTKAISFYTSESFGSQLRKNGISITAELLSSTLSSLIPVVGPIVGSALKSFIELIRNNKK